MTPQQIDALKKIAATQAARRANFEGPGEPDANLEAWHLRELEELRKVLENVQYPAAGSNAQDHE